MKKYFLIVVVFIIATTGFSQRISQYGNVYTDSFPEVSFYVNVYDRVEHSSNDFTLKENLQNVNFQIQKVDRANQNHSKTVLILFEDMTHSSHAGQKRFFQNMLSNSLAKFVKKGDKVNIAVFDRNRDGQTPYRYLLSDYTDDVNKLLEAVSDFTSKNDYHSNNKGSNLYDAIYSGLTELNENYQKDNKLVLVLSAGYNYTSTGDNTQESIIQYSKENKTPIYAINYLIWENNTLNKMAKESFGLYFNTKTDRSNLSEATDSVISYMNKAVPRLLGYNYKVTFNTISERDGASHLAILSIGNASKEINFTFPKCDIVCWAQENIYIAGGIIAGFLLIVILIFILLRKKKKKKELKAKEIEAQHKAELEKQKEAQQKTEAKLSEIERKKELDIKKKKEAEQREITRQLLIKEIKAGRGFPMLSVSLGADNYEYTLENPEITVGREADNDMFISNQSISRKHFKISYRAGNFYIEDLGSTNGTILNGQMIVQSEKLNNNDIIQIGPIKIVFVW